MLTKPRALHGYVFSILAAVPTTMGCSEPCLYARYPEARADETPFADGSTVFSKCASCPIDKTHGPATACNVAFTDGTGPAGVVCLYGPAGDILIAASSGAVTGVPNQFSFCKARCPDEGAADVHTCSLRADAKGVTSMRCLYGQTCG
jgi:hypothetical protein